MTWGPRCDKLCPTAGLKNLLGDLGGENVYAFYFLKFQCLVAIIIL